MIDPQKEKLLSLSEAAHSLPCLDGKRPHPSTVFRWMTDGVRGGIRLEHLRIGRRICTSAEALTRFMQTLSEAPAPEATPPQISSPRIRTPKQRERDMATARKRLKSAGVIKTPAVLPEK